MFASQMPPCRGWPQYTHMVYGATSIIVCIIHIINYLYMYIFTYCSCDPTCTLNNLSDI